MPQPNVSPKSTAPDPQSMNPQTAGEYAERGWLYYSKDDYTKAEADFRKALETEPKNADTLFALALNFKASGSPQQAIHTFEEVITALPAVEDSTRAHMLERLVHGHINQLKQGDWNLEKEIWHRKS
jgi:tetratricopeptide (TPR) repeat protein